MLTYQKIIVIKILLSMKIIHLNFIPTIKHFYTIISHKISLSRKFFLFFIIKCEYIGVISLKIICF